MSDERAPSPSGLLARLRRQPSDLYTMILDPILHPQGLNRLAALTLERDWPHAAFAFADRRCRIPPVPNARDYLLRAEASRRVGDITGAVADVRTARDIDPLDPLVNLQALRCLEGDERIEAAKMLVASSRAMPAQLAAALECLEGAGVSVNAQIDAAPEELSGWVAWPRGTSLVCRIEEEHCTQFVVRSDAQHPLATPTRSAAAFAIRRSPDVPSRVRFVGQSPDVLWEAMFEPFELRCAVPRRRSVDAKLQPAMLVVVPVYGDHDATVACLDSLRTQTLSSEPIATVVVDDASPDARIVAELDARAARGDFLLVRNPRNLGFAVSVNAAVAMQPAGEILLLNADTVLPPRALERLLNVLRSDPAVGTVTPLSNNGELTSFPALHSFNPLPDPAELLAWDAAAANAAAPPLDLPNGIGFCMLVRRACWEQLDGIASIYGRGYYEDVDLCLRARDLGYRNVCATNLIVGHAGSRSFRGMKRALVIRNLEIVRTRFPDFETESAAFLRAAPLRPIFAAIERHIPPQPHDVVLVTALTGAHPTLQARIHALIAAGERVLLLSVVDGAGRVASTLRSLSGGVPQSLSFTLTDFDGRQALLGYLTAAIHRIEIVDIENCPNVLLDTLWELGCPIDVLAAGVRSLVDPGERGVRAPILSDSGSRAREAAPRLPGWAARLRPSDCVIGSDALAVAAAQRVFAGYPGVRVDPEPRRAPTCLFAARSHPAISTLAVLSPVATGAVTRLIAALRDRLARAQPAAELLVIGETINDVALIAAGGTFVTGSVPNEEFTRVLEAYGTPPLVSPYRDGLFHLIEAAGATYPTGLGYFDWAANFPARAGDLALDPGCSDAEASARIVDWFAGPAPNIGSRCA
ncbi:glycosyltransferase family 2 protein [Methylobacterium fujisawaense]